MVFWFKYDINPILNESSKNKKQLILPVISI